MRFPNMALGAVAGLGLTFFPLAYAGTSATAPPVTTAPTQPSAAMPDVTKVATTFADSLGLLDLGATVICYPQSLDGRWTFCATPVNPGISPATGLVCDVAGCVLSPSGMPLVPPSSAKPHTP
jgi:hypothetical protein